MKKFCLIGLLGYEVRLATGDHLLFSGPLGNDSVNALVQQQTCQTLPLATRVEGGTFVVLLPKDEAAPLSSRVELVQWRDTDARAGHIADIDGDGLLKAVVHVGDKQYPKDLSLESSTAGPRLAVSLERSLIHARLMPGRLREFLLQAGRYFVLCWI